MDLVLAACIRELKRIEEENNLRDSQSNDGGHKVEEMDEVDEVEEMEEYWGNGGKTGTINRYLLL